MKHLYTAVVTAAGGREGRVASNDGILDLLLSIPKALGGPGAAATNPEQLFAAGYSACFESAIRFSARAQKASVDGLTVTAEVGIGQAASGVGFALAVALKVSLPGLDPAQAQALVDAAHRVCPYSNATRGNIDVAITLV